MLLIFYLLTPQRRQSGSKSGGLWIRSQKFSIPVEKISDFAEKFSIY